MKILATVATLVAVSSAAHAQPGALDVSGNYVGTWGAATLRQDGTHVTGTYAYHDGHIDGALADHTLSFTWSEDDGSGRGVFAVANDGSLYGTWGTGDSASNGGSWTLTRGGEGVTAPTPAGDGLAPADPRGLMTSLRMPFELGGGGGALQVGWAGLGLDIGDRLSQHWYVGASSDVELYSIEPMSWTADIEGKDTARVRVGGEVRYYFDDGVGAASIDCGPAFPVPRRTWFGARLGAESLDGGSTIGEFGDITLGTTFQLGGTGIGMYGSFGISSEPASAIPGATMPPMSGTQGIDAVVAGAGPTTPNVTSYLGTFGMIVTFGRA
ncbi:MAG TPA: hypothetical protein VMJ10_19595 [Kofleriaceae bacterium]|nr:hypothetical protein [Kofleriaceae bacterium]